MCDTFSLCVSSNRLLSSAELLHLQIMMEEEVKELKEVVEDLKQKLTSAEKLHEVTVEKYSQQTAEYNKKVHKNVRLYSISSHLQYLIVHHTVL